MKPAARALFSTRLFERRCEDPEITALADITFGQLLNAIVEVGWPQKFRMNDLVRRVMQAKGDGREVIH